MSIGRRFWAVFAALSVIGAVLTTAGAMATTPNPVIEASVTGQWVASHGGGWDSPVTIVIERDGVQVWNSGPFNPADHQPDPGWPPGSFFRGDTPGVEVGDIVTVSDGTHPDAVVELVDLLVTERTATEFAGHLLPAVDFAGASIEAWFGFNDDPDNINCGATVTVQADGTWELPCPNDLSQEWSGGAHHYDAQGDATFADWPIDEDPVPEEVAAAIVSALNEALSTGSVHRGTGRSLLALANTASSHLQSGRVNGVCGNATGFLRRLDNSERHGRIDAEFAGSLRDQMMLLRDLLEC